jgi:5-methylcytosine-specific restriction endonuclease McrA
MSHQQADHFSPVKLRDRRLLRLAHKLRALQRAWRQPEPFFNSRREDMNPPLSGWQRALWDRQSGRCAYCCGPLWPRYHYDHKIPKSKGGPSHPDNYALACEPCNLSKHDQDSVSFAIRLLLS